MALNTLKCNHVTSLGLKGLTVTGLFSVLSFAYKEGRNCRWLGGLNPSYYFQP